MVEGGDHGLRIFTFSYSVSPLCGESLCMLDPRATLLKELQALLMGSKGTML